MKLSLFLLSLTIFAAGQALPANAQEGGNGGGVMDGGSRWIYKPNVWGSKKATKPVPKAYVPHTVTAHAMPHANAFLGIDPSELKRPAPTPPPVQQQTQIALSVPHTQAAPFNKDFGAPVTEHIAQPKPMTESSMPAAKSMSPSQIASSGNVSGRLRRTPHTSSAHAVPASLPAIQSYGQGYTPGAFGAGTGAGTQSSTSLNGRIVSKTH